MREIKFRIYDAGKMIYNPKITKEIKEDYANKDIPINDLFHCSLIMQYTGSKDINDKEIYEGDIVFLPEWNGRTEVTVVVKWGYMGWEPYVNNNPDYETSSVEFSKVIGNIHENPELLEDKSDEHKS